MVVRGWHPPSLSCPGWVGVTLLPSPSPGLSCKAFEWAPCPKCSSPVLKPENGKCVATVSVIAGGIATCCLSALSLFPCSLIVMTFLLTERASTNTFCKETLHAAPITSFTEGLTI